MNRRAHAAFQRGRSAAISTLLRLIGALVLMASLMLPLASCTQYLPGGESATVLLQHTLSLNALSDSDGWPWIAAYFWPLLVLPLFRVLRGARALLALRVAEVLLLSYSAYCLGTVLLIARPEPGFYLGALGLLAYAAGMARGAPRAVMRRAGAMSQSP